MTIPINILQSMISRNKDTIYEKECRLLLIKTMHIDRKNERMCEAYKKFLHNKKKEIKALVAIQKALKKEMAEKVRCAAYFKWQTEVSRKMWNMTRITRRDS